MFVITEVRIDGLGHMPDGVHPEATPIGPFATREEAWAYAHALQRRYGTGGGSVDVALLHAPRTEFEDPPPRPPWEQYGASEEEWARFTAWRREKAGG